MGAVTSWKRPKPVGDQNTICRMLHISITIGMSAIASMKQTKRPIRIFMISSVVLEPSAGGVLNFVAARRLALWPRLRELPPGRIGAEVVARFEILGGSVRM
jgi:hypothetical protein